MTEVIVGESASLDKKEVSMGVYQRQDAGIARILTVILLPMVTYSDQLDSLRDR